MLDAAGFDAFYRAAFPRVLTACRAFTSDSDVAMDAAQEAFARAFAHWNRIGQHEWPVGWVIATALNQCRRRFRRRPHPSVADSVPAISTDRIEIVEALRRLAPRRRTAAVLFYVADLSVADVAQAMRLSEGAVRSHLTHARRDLRRALGGSDE
ncbi:MAG TPA: sigma-70 family RNA polymerase sigma factor [Actinomycetota bacterium]|nr:sigma-70 family RNA polymerase sigma factor [Actinomycetota bacterium]